MSTARSVTILRVALVFGLTTAIVLAMAFRWRDFPAHFDDMIAMLGGPEGLATIEKADKVEAFRIQQEGFEQNALFYSVISGPVPMPADLVANVTAALTDPQSYDWPRAKGCTVDYGVKLSFIRAADRIDVFLCFQCDELYVEHNGTPTGGEDFDAIRPVLVRVVKSLFPDDAVIQALKEED